MDHPFLTLQPEYEQLLATMVVAQPNAVDAVARKLVDQFHLPRYQAVQAATGVPAVLIASLDERESDANPRLGLGQGDPWGQVSVHVPRGQGPFPSWADAAVFYVHYDHLDDTTQPWSWSYFCWKGEAWNGFGPRNHGIHTGYLWAGTNHYTQGKYVADGQWDPTYVDKQLGIVPIAQRMTDFDLSLDIGAIMSTLSTPTPPPLITPAGVSSVGPHDVSWLQTTLNKVFLDASNQLLVDGNYGHHTRTAVWGYQQAHGLTTDGLFGPQTDASLTAELAKLS